MGTGIATNGADEAAHQRAASRMLVRAVPPCAALA